MLTAIPIKTRYISPYIARMRRKAQRPEFISKACLSGPFYLAVPNVVPRGLGRGDFGQNKTEGFLADRFDEVIRKPRFFRALLVGFLSPTRHCHQA
jgi:hypothetical protein